MAKEQLASAQNCSLLEKILKSGPLRMHFQHSGAKIRVFEENTGIIKFWLFYSAAGHEYSVVFTRLFESSRGLCVFLVMDMS